MHVLWYSPGKPKEPRDKCFVPNARRNYLVSLQMLPSGWQVLLWTKPLSPAVRSHEQNKTLLHSFVLFVKVPGFLSILNLATQWDLGSRTFVLEWWWRNLPRYRLIKHTVLAKYFCHLMPKFQETILNLSLNGEFQKNGWKKEVSIKIMRLEPPFWRASSIPHLDPLMPLPLFLLYFTQQQAKLSEHSKHLHTWVLLLPH